MDLDRYLISSRTRGKDFAARLGVDVSTISRFRHGHMWPSREMAQRIIEASKGRVSWDEWLKRFRPSERARGGDDGNAR